MLKLINKKKFAFCIICMFITGLDGMVIPQAVSGLISAIEIQSTTLVIYNAVFVLSSYFVIRTALFFWGRLQASIVNGFLIKIKNTIFIRSFNSPKNEMLAQINGMLNNDVKYIEENYINSMFHMIYCLFFSFITSVYVLIIDWKIGLLFVVSSSFPIITSYFSKEKTKVISLKVSQLGEASLDKSNEFLAKRETINYFKASHYFQNRWINLYSAYESERLNLTNYLVLIKWINNLISGLSSLVPLFIGGFLVLNDDVSLANLIAVYLASDRILSPLVNAIEYLNKINSARPIEAKIQRYLSCADIKNISLVPLEFPIIYQNVKLGYGQYTVLENLNFRINKGDKILLIGKTGVGKSTLLKSLLDSDLIVDGVVLSGERDVSGFHLLNVGYYTQSPIIFNDSIQFNLELGDHYEINQLIEVLNEVNLMEYASVDKLLFQVGVDGNNLSGGQRARLALARILLRRENYQILLLDELDSSLDQMTTQIIRKNIYTKFDTVIEISHKDIIEHGHIIRWHLKDKRLEKEGKLDAGS